MTGASSTRIVFCAVLVAAAVLSSDVTVAAPGPPDQTEMRTWIGEMKASDRGPFARIRWFCKDGSVLPPDSYACRERGGGSQHGEWSERTKALRAQGYLIANVYADMDVDALMASPDLDQAIAQMLAEQFLIAADDGWVLRKARYYRGAFQEEGERAGAQRLLLRMAGDERWFGRRYLAMRSAATLLAHGPDTPTLIDVRRLSGTLAETDPDFVPIRNKIHARPEASDSVAVRAHAVHLANDTRREEFLRLAQVIDAVYAAPLDSALERYAELAAGLGDAGADIVAEVRRVVAANAPEARFLASARAMAAVRDALAKVAKPSLRLALIDATVTLETIHVTAATALRDALEHAPRRQTVDWLAAGIGAAYGTGWLSQRQKHALDAEIARLGRTEVDGRTYKAAVDYLALVPGWAAQWARFNFDDGAQRLAVLDPLAAQFIPDQLRSGPLFFFSQALNVLARDANRLAGVQTTMFEKDVSGRVRPLNQGLARGRLLNAPGGGEPFRESSIYILPETVADLPPVSGILTAGEGNPLSHVQLLARNLGIPNVAIDQSLLATLDSAIGGNIVLAVSPRGSVNLTRDDGALDSLFATASATDEAEIIRPDLGKLDLAFDELVPLSELRAEDSGRIVGPKAAKLGELQYHYAEAVAEGLAIPFGVFNALLEQPHRSGSSAFKWMVGRYRALERLPNGSEQRAAETEAFRAELQQWIETAESGEAFRSRLRTAMAERFGPDGSYGVFVRSDTNVEDLPGFTGAGLNLTVPHVVGFENVVAAIARVWASPFSARAFAWRQARMSDPEHVYPAVLLMRSVPVDKSGVLVTANLDSGDPAWMSIAANEGVGGVVDGQAAEALRVELATGAVRLLSQATATGRRRLQTSGGVKMEPTSELDTILQPDEITALIALVKELPKRFPPIVDAQGQSAPADIEFGFQDGELRLFQIRPFVDSVKAKSNAYLRMLDNEVAAHGDQMVDLNKRPQS